MKLLIAAIAALAAPLVAQPTIEGAVITSGFAPRLTVSGLQPGERVRVHAIRMYSVWEAAGDGSWHQVPRPLHSWAEFDASSDGKIDLWTFGPRAGTYAGTDAYGLLWSGRPVASDADRADLPLGVDLASMKDGQSVIVVTRDGATLVSTPLTSAGPRGIATRIVAEGRINGAYSAPNDGKHHPTLVLLHGSEGGGQDEARSLAERFAGQGYAAFALNYFAWDLKKLSGVPNAHVNQPIELIAQVRDWLRAQPEADVERFGLYGHSKGAEYAEVAAVHLPWIKAVAACVPTDAVWEGYGIGDPRNTSNPFGQPPARYSSFSWRGVPLPYIPLEGDRSAYRVNTDFYEAKRVERPGLAQAALIPIERAKASFLWLGGGRDQTWASGTMAERLDARLRAHGAGQRSNLRVFPASGHAICGDGTYPTRLWQADSTDPRDPDRDAEGRATALGWQAIVEFFKRTL